MAMICVFIDFTSFLIIAVASGNRKSRHFKINSEVTALSIAGIRVPEMKKAPSHLCDLCATSNSYSIIQISSNYAKLPQPKKRGEGGLKSTPKIGSRLTTLGTTFPSFRPLFGQLTTCGPLKIG
jgi:hypothetical protein